MEIGTKVKIKLHGKNYHIGIFLGVDELGNHKIGVLETTIPGVSIKPGKEYISIFNTSYRKMMAI